MVEKIKDQKLYHVTIATPYKQTLVADQVIRVGDIYNPFFAFYEGSRVYPVKEQDGTVVLVRAVKFLKQVQDGFYQLPRIWRRLQRK
jgi:hypothetical protein